MTPEELGQSRIHYVRVTNGLDTPFHDRYDGVPITIPPGHSENIPLDMAAHFFGYHPGIEPTTMLRYVAKRQGWNTPDYVKQDPATRKTLAEQLFAKLKIEPVAYKLVPASDPDPREPVPADPDPEAEPPSVRKDRPRNRVSPYRDSAM
jgi:hypothetical protein